MNTLGFEKCTGTYMPTKQTYICNMYSFKFFKSPRVNYDSWIVKLCDLILKFVWCQISLIVEYISDKTGGTDIPFYPLDIWQKQQTVRQLCCFALILVQLACRVFPSIELIRVHCYIKCNKICTQYNFFFVSFRVSVCVDSSVPFT